MTFDEIWTLVSHDAEISEKANLTDQQCYHTLKAINIQYKNKAIFKSQATREKENLIRRYDEQKKLDELRKERWEQQTEYISRSADLRKKLNLASKEGYLSKQLWFDAIECIGLMCGNLTEWNCCKDYLKEFDDENQEVST